MQIQKKCFLIGMLAAAAVVGLDQWSKWWVLARLALPPEHGMQIAPFFNVVLVWNYGISFGMFAGHRQPVLLTLMSAVIIVMLMIWLAKTVKRSEALALGFVIGGAVGNDIDRVRFEAVVDFLDFYVGQYHWPAFNVADSCIFIGVVLLCSSSMFSGKPSHGTTP